MSSQQMLAAELGLDEDDSKGSEHGFSDPSGEPTLSVEASLSRHRHSIGQPKRASLLPRRTSPTPNRPQMRSGQNADPLPVEIEFSDEEWRQLTRPWSFPKTVPQP